VISVISVWNGWFFFIDENGMYHRGDGYFLQIGVTYGYIIFSAIKTTFHMLKTKDFKEQNTYLTMLSYFIFPMVFGILQIINQNSPYLCIGIALSILQTYLFIVNFEQERDVSSSKIHSLSRLFKSSFYLDLQTGSLEVLGEAKQDSLFLFSEYMTSKDSELFTESIKYYAKKYVHEQDREMFYRMCSVDYMEKHLNKENLFYFFNYRQIADGIERWYRVHIMVAAFAPNNHIHKVVLAVMDVDKQVKNEIHQKSALEEALVEAKKANKAKTAFLSNVSHDIRTPMNAIVGFSNLAKSHIEDRELVSNYLEKILSAGNHLLSLINDVLDMSRIESGKVRIDENEYNLLEIIEEVKMMMLPQAQEKELEFFVDCEIQNHYVYCDKLRLNQIFINLLGNAVKFTTQGGKIDWKIRQIPIVQSGFGAYIFSIKDNGIGIAPEFLDKIFDAFEREKNGKTNGIQGTGLGLSITKNMVELMGGRISVESKVGEGTEFIVKVVFLLQDVDEEIMHQKKLQNKAQEVHLKAQEKELQKHTAPE
ncbi:MAG: HAMP domain-containing histidine kinase, partial [Lachnospiraceae bacterium]|nr:HAMP domain-containing histidine kinase [Lachnospiraceae bacterium]